MCGAPLRAWAAGAAVCTCVSGLLALLMHICSGLPAGVHRGCTHSWPLGFDAGGRAGRGRAVQLGVAVLHAQ